MKSILQHHWERQVPKLCSIGLIFTLSMFVLFSSNSSTIIRKGTPRGKYIETPNRGGCDLFKGRWIPDSEGSPYTNSSCPTIPQLWNCLRHGRKDRDLVNWRWKPDGCELSRFEPKTFLRIVQGKVLAFIGDSLAQNHMESLICLLSQEERPTPALEDVEDPFITWYFPIHNFTIMKIWSRFLVKSRESSTKAYHAYLDKVDEDWSQKLQGINYAIVDTGNWPPHKTYIYKGNDRIGCLHCREPNITNLPHGFVLREVYRTALKYISTCNDCRDLTTILRTISSAHPKKGSWGSGGYCRRTRPLREEEISIGGSPWESRNIQLKEFRRAKTENRDKGKKYDVIDVTRAMLMRPDGHPGLQHGEKWRKAVDDCLHWCLPGPIDVWNDFLLAVLRKGAAINT
ncbi:Trichome birefringence-like, N-terminal domain [Dillenia turbinata]|uniref:Trichome birefringence-like, N-terminal domain n=1 Tax=Dillenia turbinata TaxID=194707 RepID=A0AAN8ZAH1_9MAGN